MNTKAEKEALIEYPRSDFQSVETSRKTKRKCFVKGYERAEKNLGWHSVKDTLPEIDEEVIALTDSVNGNIVPGSHMICYAHRPNPKGWDGKSIETGEAKHYDVVTYDGWNIPGVTHWMHLPSLSELK